MSVLEFALAQPYRPGSNRGDGQLDPTWLFLMPSLELGNVVVLGVPDVEVLALLAGRSRSVVVVAPSRRALRRAERALRARPVVRTRFVLPAGETALSHEGPDVVYVTARRAAAAMRDPELRAAIRSTVERGGSVVIEPSWGNLNGLTRLFHECGVCRILGLRAVDEAPADAMLEPRHPEPVTALTLPPARSRGAGLLRRAVSRLGRRVARRLRLTGAATVPNDGLLAIALVTAPIAKELRGRTLLLRRDHRAGALPDYVGEVAREAGHELRGTSWAILPPRGFRSQKVAFMLGEAVVKLTQEETFNSRLENEYRALRTLESLRLCRITPPRALFCGQHASLLVVGETRVEGVPFRDRSSGSPACPVAARVLEGLIELGTAGRRPVPGEDAASALLTLLDNHERVHRPSSKQMRFLADQIAVIRDAAAFSATLTHGDPSTLNILVREREIGLLDWENAEAAGMPLWDLFYFVNAYAAWNAELEGVRYTAAETRLRLAGDSAFRELLVGAIGRSRTALDLPVDVVAPLFFTFWMQLALREATRLPAGKAARGRYARLWVTSLHTRHR